MLKKIIYWSVANRVLVLLLALVLAVLGMVAIKQTPLDAIPDLSDVQVIIRTSFPGQSPEVVENQVTYPITTTMLSVPGARVVRGYSFFGDSYVYVVFDDNTDLYWARSRVLEYLSQAEESLPAGLKPRLGPDATGVGWIYSYALVDRSGKQDLAELRSLQDWFLKFELQTVSGVAEVATVGGMVRQYQVIAKPDRLRAYKVSLDQVAAAIRESNEEVGGSVIEQAEAEFMIHSKGYLQTIEDIEMIPVVTYKGRAPLLVRDLAEVQLGPEMRRVVTDLDGEGEVTGGIVVMRSGENALKTIDAVREKMAQLKRALPAGVEIVETYDRSTLIRSAVKNISDKLVQEFLIVALVCSLFLFHLRSSLVIIISLPLGILMAFIVMRAQGVNANIMSLGGIAIAIGAMVDAAIVMIENVHKKMESWHAQNSKSLDSDERWKIIASSTAEVGPALFLSLMIITLSFLPIFTLEAQEGRLFTPLALTKTYAMAMAAALAVTIVPVLMGYFIRGDLPSEMKSPLNRVLLNIYRPALEKVLNYPRHSLVVAGLVLLSMVLPLYGVSGLLAPLKWTSVFSNDTSYEHTIENWQEKIEAGWRKWFGDNVIGRMGQGLGSEFMPTMNEGDLMYMPTTLPGISIGKAQQLLQQTDRLIRQVPEVKQVFGKMGRADTATDPAPLTMIETVIQLKPRDQWRDGLTLEMLIDELDSVVDLPGITNAWLMPVKTRIDMLATGIKTPVGVRVAGPELEVIERIGRQIEQALKPLHGTRSVYSERISGGRYIQIIPDRTRAAFYGVKVSEINRLVRAAVGGINITQIIDGAERYPVNIRFAREVRDDIEKLSLLPVITQTGAEIPLSMVAEIKVADGPPVIKSENARRSGWTFIDISHVDLSHYIKQAQKRVMQEVELPSGYSVDWAGQYEYMQRAGERMQIVIPLTLIIVFILLYLIFKRIDEVLIILLTLPFALVGGFWLLLILDYQLSVATAVGFIGLVGVAAEFSVIMLLFLNKVKQEKEAADELKSLAELKQAVIEGAVLRLRPKVMTVAVIVAGLVPVMLGNDAGSEVMQRIAAPMIGGMLSAPVMSMFVIPLVYLQWEKRKLKGA